MSKFSLASYLQGPDTGPVPTQTYNSSNIFGTAVPRVGDSKAKPNYQVAAGGTSTFQVVTVVLFLIFVGYLLYHLSYEK